MAKKERCGHGEEGILLVEAGRVFFRQYDKTKRPWTFRDYYLDHPDLKIRITDKSAVLRDGVRREMGSLDISLSGLRRRRAREARRGNIWG